jgi:hypothetical protein
VEAVSDVPTFVLTLPPQEQIEWFRDNNPVWLAPKTWDDYYVDSVQHKGLCCSSCISDYVYEERWPHPDDACCCYGKDKDA